MALRDLVEGECGGPSPLIHLTSHFVKDHGLKEEGVRELFGTIDPFETGNSDQLVKQFLEETSVHPQTFKMENLLQEMREIDQSVYPPVTAPGVVEELTNQDTAWANQYLQSGKHFQENHRDDIWNVQPTHPNAKVAFPGETHELGLGPKWAEEYLEHSIDHPETAASKSENPAYSKFMKFMRQEGDLPIETSVPVTTENVENKWVNDFTETENMEPLSTISGESKGDETNVLNSVDEQTDEVATWINELSKNHIKEQDHYTIRKSKKQLVQLVRSSKSAYGFLCPDAESYKSSFWETLQNEWEKISSTDNVSTNHPWLSEYDNFYDPYKEYTFSADNPMSDLSNPLEAGKQRLENGDLPGAVLCFEAAVKKDSQNPEGWLLLGKTQAENEQDPLAISALKQCLTLDPTNLTALMALAVSYTNESYQSQACLTLKEWLLKNDRYKHIKTSKSPTNSSPQAGVSTVLFNDLHNEVKDLFIQAARMQPHGTIDADVQSGLGVLFNLSNEYDKAVDCFKAAIQVRPKDPMLWNRLGAILANGKRSEEAIEAYHQALELSPGFIRARYNLGISCINLNAFKEAGEHLLTALNQQAAGKGVFGERAPTRIMSDTIWSTLRLVLSLMHKYHLNDAIEHRDLARLNKEFEME